MKSRKKHPLYPMLTEQFATLNPDNQTPEIVMITTFPPRQCGIATYSQDLISALNNHYVDSFSIKICALENKNEKHNYEDPDVKYILDTSSEQSYISLAKALNEDDNIKIVLIQHEFGLFAESVGHFNTFINALEKPLSVVFHTILPNPNEEFKANVQHILNRADSLVVMTHNAADILVRDYIIDKEHIFFI